MPTQRSIRVPPTAVPTPRPTSTIPIPVSTPVPSPTPEATPFPTATPGLVATPVPTLPRVEDTPVPLSSPLVPTHDSSSLEVPREYGQWLFGGAYCTVPELHQSCAVPLESGRGFLVGDGWQLLPRSPYREFVLLTSAPVPGEEGGRWAWVFSCAGEAGDYEDRDTLLASLFILGDATSFLPLVGRSLTAGAFPGGISGEGTYLQPSFAGERSVEFNGENAYVLAELLSDSEPGYTFTFVLWVSNKGLLTNYETAGSSSVLGSLPCVQD